MTSSELPTIRAFISYAHADREHGRQVKNILARIGVDSFLAHEDLEVSEQWRERILEELRNCDLFVPILSASFMKSIWAPQEVGFIVSRPKVVVAPLSADGTTPGGFISHVQSSRIQPEGITRSVLVDPLARQFPRTILPGLIRMAGDAGTFRSAEAEIGALVRFFPVFSPHEAQALAEVAVRNGQIWSAGKCRAEYLPKFIESQRANIAPGTLRALEYQVANDERYTAENEQPGT